MKIGDIVRNKETGRYGTVEYSSFGVSIHIWDEDRNALSKTLGAPITEVSAYWEVVDLPKGYVEAEYGGIKRSDSELINRRRRQILVHSALYYRFNTTLISDAQYDAWARELMELQRNYPEIAAECIHADSFANFSETTSGYDLPLYGWVEDMARRLLAYHNESAK